MRKFRSSWQRIWPMPGGLADMGENRSGGEGGVHLYLTGSLGSTRLPCG